MLIAIIILLSILLIVSMHFLVQLSRNQCVYQQPNYMPPQPHAVTIAGPYTPMPNIVEARDRAVMKEPLYPPVSRDVASNTMRLLNEPRLQPTADSSDSFQLLGYIISRDDKTDVWKLIARSTGRGQADFYAQSSNTNLDVKIPLTQEIVKSVSGSSGSRFRDMYDLPDAVAITHPMFKGPIYDVVVLPRAQLGSGYI